MIEDVKKVDYIAGGHEALSVEEQVEYIQRIMGEFSAHEWLSTALYLGPTLGWQLTIHPQYARHMVGDDNRPETTEVTASRSKLMKTMRGKRVKVIDPTSGVVYQQPSPQQRPQPEEKKLTSEEIIQRLSTHEDIYRLFVDVDGVWQVHLSDVGSKRCVNGLYSAFRSDLCKLLGETFRVFILDGEDSYTELPLSLDPHEPPGYGVEDIKSGDSSPSIEEQLRSMHVDEYDRSLRTRAMADRILSSALTLANSHPQLNARKLVLFAGKVVRYADKLAIAYCDQPDETEIEQD